jgi:hypothetical protein
MRNEFKLLALVPVFGMAGAAATAMLWQVFSWTLMTLIPPPYAVLGCAVSGLLGPLLVGFAVWRASREARAFRGPAAVGLGIVLATELAFYVPLGFMVAAFSLA